MKIDNFDNTMICENDEFESVLSFFKENREIPEYIELSILKIVSKKMGLQDCYTIKEYLNNLPKDFVDYIISTISRMYGNNFQVNYNNRHLPYLMYYLPTNIFKVWKPLLDLQTRDLLKAKVEILDVGTGPGSVPIGIIEYYKSLAVCFKEIEFALEFTLIEKEIEFMDIANKMINEYTNNLPENLHVKIVNQYHALVSGKNNYDLLGTYDMVIMSNFLASGEELNQENAYDIIRNFKSNIKKDGSLIVIEPADKRNCIPLKRLRNNVVNNRDLNVYSPCIGVWEIKENYSCECFNMVRSYWKLPKIYEFLLKKGLSKGKRLDVPFNYIIFRKDNKKKYDIIKNQKHFVKLCDLKDYLSKKVNVIAIIRTVIYKQETDIVKIALCDGTIFCTDFEAVWIEVTKKSLNDMGINIPLIAAERIKLNGVTVKACNKDIYLIVDRNTRIRVEY